MATPREILTNLLTVMRQHGYVVFSRPYELNLVGLRNANPTSGVFDDDLFVFYKDDSSNWHLEVLPITTDPGTFWLENPMRPEGTAMIAQGQYINAYKLGKHRGKFDALVQVKPIDFWRLKLNADKSRYTIVGRAKGQIGANIHRGSIGAGPGTQIGKDSAGCQVIAKRTDDTLLLGLAKKHLLRYPGGITYTLIDFRSYDAADTLNTIKLVISGLLIVWVLNFLAGKIISRRSTKSRVLPDDGLGVVKAVFNYAKQSSRKSRKYAA